MKPAAFDYVRPSSVAEALRELAGTEGAKVLAGGQTLGPMLNMRLAQPALLVDITRIKELAAVAEDKDTVSIGATVTHAAIEDGRVPDPTGGFLARVARGIAYRAVRNRGTIGGSLAHADPAADWPAIMIALGASLNVRSARATRCSPSTLSTPTTARATCCRACPCRWPMASWSRCWAAMALARRRRTRPSPA